MWNQHKTRAMKERATSGLEPHFKKSSFHPTDSLSQILPTGQASLQMLWGLTLCSCSCHKEGQVCWQLDLTGGGGTGLTAQFAAVLLNEVRQLLKNLRMRI